MYNIKHISSDALQAHESSAHFMASERARWALAQPQAITGAWSPTMTAQQQREHEQYVIDNNLPF